MVMTQRGWWCLLLIGLAAIGCGDDDGGGAPKDGGAAGQLSGGSGGASGRASGGGTGGSAGRAATVMPVPCGTATCQPPQSPFSAFASFLPPGILPMPAPCCLEEESNLCGLAPTVGGMCEEPATRDTRCAGIEIAIPGMMGGALGGLGFGCCTANDQCGIDGSIAGRGCIENSMASGLLGPLAGFLMLPAPKSCDAPLPMAGTGGTGGSGGAGAGADAGLDAGPDAGGDEDAGAL